MLKQVLSICLFIILSFCNNFSYSQCGATANGIIFTNADPANVMLNADYALQPGWVAYKFKYVINGNITNSSTSFISDAELYPGISLVNLTVYATNPSTLDSCTATYGNVYWSMGPNVAPMLDFTVSGLTVDYTVSWLGQIGGPEIIMNYGDGTCDTNFANPHFTHTYATAGDYVAYASIATTSPPAFWPSRAAWREVHVGNGLPNYQYCSVNVTNVACDSVEFRANTSPAFTNASCYTTWEDLNGGSLLPEFYNLSDNDPFYKKYEIPGIHVVQLHIDDTNSSFDYYNYKSFAIQDCNVLPPDTVSGYVYYDANNDGIYSAGDTPASYYTINVSKGVEGGYGYETTSDVNGYYKLPVPHIDVDLRMKSGYSYPQQYYIKLNTASMHTGYNFLAAYQAPTNVNIYGTVFFDYNHDTIFNGNDRLCRNASIKAVNTNNNTVYVANTSYNGSDYHFKLPAGNYVVSVYSSQIDSMICTPDTFVVNSTSGTYFKNFAITSSLSGSNLGLHFYNFTARPGFVSNISTNILNTGFDSSAAILTLSFDPALVMDSVVPAGGVINNTNHTVTWQTPFVPCLAYIYYAAYYTLPASAPLGTIYTFAFTATVNGGATDHDLTNNTVSGTILVIGSYDPNDKSVFPRGSGSAGNVLHVQELDYRINFQNTGTASAINVSVQDTISPNFDLSTFTMIRASHYYTMELKGRVITWHFYNIYLPDSNFNEPASHGFIEYSIKPIQGLPDGSSVENTAAIYFDFNAPVITNTTVNTLQTIITGVADVGANSGASVFPVPTNDELYISHGQTQGNITIALCDVAGKKLADIFKGKGTEQPLIKYSLRNFAAGVYFVKLQGENGVEVLKVVKE